MGLNGKSSALKLKRMKLKIFGHTLITFQQVRRFILKTIQYHKDLTNHCKNLKEVKHWNQYSLDR